MQLEHLAARLRVRAPWEAADLGQALLRRFAGPVYAAWFATVLPVYVLLGGVLPAGWALFAAWWLRPMYDRVVLHVLSRALFGSVPGLRDVFGSLPGLWLRGTLARLILRRFDPLRSYILPAEQLEGLQGARWAPRIRHLRLSADRAASALTTFGPVIELAITVGAFAVLGMLLPEDAWELSEFVADQGGDGIMLPTAAWLGVALLVVHFIATTVLEPAYVAAGFALYLNRRTVSEGWDIELRFRQLAQRIAASPRRLAALPLVLIGVLALLSPSLPAQGGAAGSDAKTEVRAVLEHPDFAVSEQRAQRRRKSGGFGGGGGGILGAGADLVVVIGIGVLAALVLVAIFRLRPTPKPPAAAAAQRPDVVAGLDLRPESLPDDVPAAALGRWRSGDARGCLGLLYRAALVQLLDRWQVPIAAADTEGDCLRRCGALPAPAVRAWFEDLTRAWVGLAYAHRPPAADAVQRLCDGWAQVAEAAR